MIILYQLNELLSKLQDNSIPDDGKLALGFLILSVISLLCFINILTYFIVLYTIETKFMQEKMDRWKLLKRIMNLYKTTSIYFIGFEILLFLYVNGFIIWSCYRLVSFYLNN
jgi:hypothetical protein